MKLKPDVPVSETFLQTIDGVVTDICHGQEVRAFLTGKEFGETESATLRTAGRCSEHFLGYLEMLSYAMAQQVEFSVSPRAAAELLYNFDAEDDEFQQPLFSLEEAEEGKFELRSTLQFEKTAGVRFVLTLDSLRAVDDWTLI